ncbi:MAG: MFS transporter, partial [Ilumatobacteraceae bacterium]
MRAPKTGTFRAAWRHRRWRALLAGYTVSSIGDFIYFVAIVVYLIDETGSAGWVAASFIARLAAATACGPVGGVLADRFDRRRLMVGLDLARAVGMVGVTVIAVGGGPPVVALVLVTVTTGLGVAYRPAAVTATPQLVTEDDLAAANAAEATVYQLAWFIGPAIGGAIIAVADTSLAFGINAATFVISALLTLGVGDIGRGSPERTDERPPSMLTSIVEGAAAIRDEPGLAPLMVLTVAVYFSFGIEQVVQVLVVSDRLGWGASGIGALNAGL